METARGSVEVREPSKLEQVSARRVSESKATVPHIYLTAELPVSAALAADGGAAGARLGDLVVRVAATALREFPRLNGAYRDGRFELYSRVNIGITLTGRDGPVVPTILDADTKTLEQVAADRPALETAANEGALAAPQLAGGTFTVADLGAFAVTTYEPVIQGGQAANLAVGGACPAPVVRGGQVVAGHVARATLVCDNRIVDGGEAAAFLTRLRKLVLEETPAEA